MTHFSCFMIILIFYYYEQMLSIKTFIDPKTISFWICTALFIYFSGSFFYFLFVESFKKAGINGQMKQVFFAVLAAKDIILSLAWFGKEEIHVIKYGEEFDLWPEGNQPSEYIRNLKR